MMQGTDRKKILLLSSSLVVVTLGFGMVIPVFPFFIEDLGGGGSELGLLVATSAFLEFIFGPIWGSISDRVGRKPVLLLGMIGDGLSLFLFGLSTQLWMLFAARALSGMLSSATTIRSTFTGTRTTNGRWSRNCRRGNTTRCPTGPSVPRAWRTSS